MRFRAIPEPAATRKIEPQIARIVSSKKMIYAAMAENAPVGIS